MAESIHYFSCGCIPELDEFCPEADKYIWQERDAATDLFVLCSDGELSAHEVEMLEFKERGARSWLTRHYQEQAERGHCKDVDLDALTEPDCEECSAPGPLGPGMATNGGWVCDDCASSLDRLP